MNTKLMPCLALLLVGARAIAQAPATPPAPVPTNPTTVNWHAALTTVYAPNPDVEILYHITVTKITTQLIQMAHPLAEATRVLTVLGDGTTQNLYMDYELNPPTPAKDFSKFSTTLYTPTITSDFCSGITLGTGDSTVPAGGMQFVIGIPDGYSVEDGSVVETPLNHGPNEVSFANIKLSAAVKGTTLSFVLVDGPNPAGNGSYVPDKPHLIDFTIVQTAKGKSDGKTFMAVTP